MEKQYSVKFFTSFIDGLQRVCRNHLTYTQSVEISGYISVEIDNVKKERYVLSELLQYSGNVVSESYCTKAFKTLTNNRDNLSDKPASNTRAKSSIPKQDQENASPSNGVSSQGRRSINGSPLTNTATPKSKRSIDVIEIVDDIDRTPVSKRKIDSRTKVLSPTALSSNIVTRDVNLERVERQRRKNLHKKITPNAQERRAYAGSNVTLQPQIPHGLQLRPGCKTRPHIVHVRMQNRFSSRRAIDNLRKNQQNCATNFNLNRQHSFPPSPHTVGPSPHSIAPSLPSGGSSLHSVHSNPHSVTSNVHLVAPSLNVFSPIGNRKHFNFHQPQNNNLQQPHNNNLQQPHNNNLQQPQNNNVQQPQNNNRQQPQNTNLQQPHNNTFQQPQNNNVQQPQNINFQQPQNSNVQQPQNNTFQQQNNKINEFAPVTSTFMEHTQIYSGNGEIVDHRLGSSVYVPPQSQNVVNSQAVDKHDSTVSTCTQQFSGITSRVGMTNAPKEKENDCRVTVKSEDCLSMKEEYSATTVPSVFDTSEVIDLDLLDDAFDDILTDDDKPTVLANSNSPSRPTEIFPQPTSEIQKSVVYYVNYFRKFHMEKYGLDIDPFTLTTEYFDELLLEFYCGIRKANGTELSPITLLRVQTNLNVYLKSLGYPYSISSDELFKTSTAFIKDKMDKRVRLPKLIEIDDNDIETLFKRGVLGCHSPETIITTMWFLNARYFLVKRPYDHCMLKWGDINLKVDAAKNVEYLEMVTGGSSQRVYEHPEVPSRCFVSFYKQYRYLRPKDSLSADSPFYLAYPVPTTDVWFVNKRFATTRIQYMWQKIRTIAELTPNKRL